MVPPWVLGAVTGDPEPNRTEPNPSFPRLPAGRFSFFAFVQNCICFPIISCYQPGLFYIMYPQTLRGQGSLRHPSAGLDELSVASTYQCHPPCLCPSLQPTFWPQTTRHRVNGIELTLARPLSVLGPSCRHHRTMAPASRPSDTFPGPRLSCLCNGCPEAETPEVYGRSLGRSEVFATLALLDV
jgi:hypothetical protein